MSKIQLHLLALFSSAFILVGCQTNKLIHSHPIQNEVDKNTAIDDINEIQIEQLTHHDWQLVSAKYKNNQPISQLNIISDNVKLKFESNNGSNSIGFTVGCNLMGSDFSLVDNRLRLGRIVATQMFCEELNESEKLLVNTMAGTSELKLVNNTNADDNKLLLKQTASNGIQLLWQGLKKPQVTFNQKGETVYWQIHNQYHQCPDGSNTCLMVRPVTYDNKGIKLLRADWDLFVGKIKGYEHDTNLEQIVRLKRFVVDPVDVKGKQFIYEFDTVVESSIVE